MSDGEAKTAYVITQGDYPYCVYLDEGEADKECARLTEADKKRRESPWQDRRQIFYWVRPVPLHEKTPQ